MIAFDLKHVIASGLQHLRCHVVLTADCIDGDQGVGDVKFIQKPTNRVLLIALDGHGVH